jgi:tRNA threonylcarbamoyladenosine biosynthesis protein TsaB
VSTSGWLLALDASTSRCTLALGRDDGTLLEDVEDDGATQASTRLHGRIERLLARAGIGASALALIACGRGPGTFTGTRVAIATAKGLALALRCEVVPVSTLAAVAGSLDVGKPSCVLAVLDARRGEIYGGWFERDGDGVRPCAAERVATMAALLAEGPPADHVIGPGIAAAPAAIPTDTARTLIPGPSARGLWRAARSAQQRGEASEPAALTAVYLRESYAELGVTTPKRASFRSPFV